MKMILILLLLIALLVGVVACNGNDVGSQELPDNAQEDINGGVSLENEENIDDDPNEEQADSFDDADESDENNYADIGFTLDFNGFTIYMNQNMADVLLGIGDPLRPPFEAPSCAFDGIDRIFSYPGVQIHTYPDGDEDFVHTISIRDDSISIYGGIFLGSSFDDVTSVFGTNYDRDFDMFTYTKGDTTLAFLIEDGIVTAITFGLIMA